MNIYVGNLPFGMSNDQLRAIFEEHGQVEEAKVITDRETGRSRGFGFVVMNDDEAAAKAIEETNNTEIEGRPLRVNEARPRPPRRF